MNSRFRIKSCLAALAVLIMVTGCEEVNDTVKGLNRPEIPYEKFTLPNGLRVIVHTDRKVPIVAVNVWYHVGAKDEREGKTGFAHLFEHLMFNGTENYPGDFFEPFQKIGATGQNGTTNSDRTNYFQNVPSHALDVALWMESDRMGHFLGALTQEVLDEQRGVVQNEKRQNENQPYGRVFITSAKATFPKGHPYSWSTIGSMEDLDAASLEDVKSWFKQYYGPNNAVLVLAGDIDLETAKRKVAHYFGDIPPGPENLRKKKWIAKREEKKVEIIYDEVPLVRIQKIWNAPELGTEDAIHLELLSHVLTSGQNSILERRLIRTDQTATRVSSFYYDREMAGQFWISADVAEGKDPEDVERAIDEELARLIQEGPDLELLETLRMNYLAGMIRGLEKVGGFGGKSDLLAMGEVYLQDPSAIYNMLFDGIRDADSEDVRAAAANWLSDGEYVLRVMPADSTLVAEGGGADRSALPEPGTPPTVNLPAPQRAKLANGMNIVLMERHEAPIVNLSLRFNAGFRNDDTLPGISEFTMYMLVRGGTENYSTLELEQRILRLGASLDTGSSLDSAGVTMSTLKQTLPASMALLAEVARRPAFDEAEMELLRPLLLAGIAQEKARPYSQALRILPPLLYGEDHPYGKPLTGSGDESVIEAIKVEDLRAFHSRYLDPEQATLLVVGDVTLDEVKKLAEDSLGDWESTNNPAKTDLPTVNQANRGRVFLVDKPDAIQSLIITGQLMPATGETDELPMNMAVSVIGGSFVSRLNMNLREDKHWSYGARSFINSSLGQQLLLTYASVQSDKTLESIGEIQREFREYLSSNPATSEEVDERISKRILGIPGRYETLGALLSSLSRNLVLKRPDDYLHKLPDKLRRLSLQGVRQAAKKHIQPEDWVWVIVGDRKMLESALRDLDIGEVEVLENI